MEIKKIDILYSSGNKKKLSIVSGCVIIKDKKVLLVRGKERKPFKFPGGYVTDNETFRETAVREAKEETGVEVKVYGEPFFYLYQLDNNLDILLIHYQVQILSGEPKASTEIEEIGWFKIDMLPENAESNVSKAIKHFLYQ